VIAGPDGNGGGLVCARRLLGWCARARVFTTQPDERFAPIFSGGDVLRLG
jgi:hypothetical protein